MWCSTINKQPEALIASIKKERPKGRDWAVNKAVFSENAQFSKGQTCASCGVLSLELGHTLCRADH